jgi:hypothetical protein
MSLGYVWIKADDGNLYDVNEALKFHWFGSEVLILFEEDEDNTITWTTPDRKDNRVIQLVAWLEDQGFKVSLDKPRRQGLKKGGRMEWQTAIRVMKIPLKVVLENKGVLRGKPGALKHTEYTLAGGIG